MFLSVSVRLNVRSGLSQDTAEGKQSVVEPIHHLRPLFTVVRIYVEPMNRTLSTVFYAQNLFIPINFPFVLGIVS